MGHADLSAQVRDESKTALGIDRGIRNNFGQREQHGLLRPDECERRIVGNRTQRLQHRIAERVLRGESSRHLRQETQHVRRGGELLLDERFCVEALRHPKRLLPAVRRIERGLRLPALVDATDVFPRLPIGNTEFLGESAFSAPW